MQQSLPTAQFPIPYPYPPQYPYMYPYPYPPPPFSGVPGQGYIPYELSNRPARLHFHCHSYCHHHHHRIQVSPVKGTYLMNFLTGQFVSISIATPATTSTTTLTAVKCPRSRVRTM